MPELEAFYPLGDEFISFRTGLSLIPDPGPFTYGTTRPVSGVNAGYVTSPTSQNTNADTTYSGGETITDTEFLGNINVTSGIPTYFYNCLFRGKITNTANNLVRTNNVAQSGAVFERCTFDNRWFPNDNASNGAHGCLQGHDVTLIRCDMMHAADGLGIVAPGNVTAWGCVMHDHWFFSPDANHLADGTHVDGVQGHGGVIGNVDLWGCDIQGLGDPTLPNSQLDVAPVFSGGTLIAGNAWRTAYAANWTGGPIPSSAFFYPVHTYPPWGTSAVLFGHGSSGTQSLTNIRIRQGWLNGGGLAMINIAPGFDDSKVNSFEITDNRVGPIGRDRQPSNGKPYLVIRNSALTSAKLTVSGNYNEDDGTPNNSLRNG